MKGSSPAPTVIVSLLALSHASAVSSEQELYLEPWSAVIDNVVASAGPAEGSQIWQLASNVFSGLSCDFRGWKQDFLFLDPALGHETGFPAEFSFDPPRSGCYLVEEFHPASCNRTLSRQVELEVNYCAGKSADYVIDQSVAGNQWNPVAHLPFYVGNEGKIRVKHLLSDGFAAADAFRFTWVTEGECPGHDTLALQQQWAHQPPSVTIDDRSAIKNGIRSEDDAMRCSENALLSGAHTVAKGEGSAEYIFEPPSTGCYRVDEIHPKAGAGCTLDAASSLKIEYCLGDQWQGDINLTENGMQWRPVGHWMFYAGYPGKVTASRTSPAPAGTHWASDAFRFTKLADCCKWVPHVAFATVHLHGANLSSATLSNGLGKHSEIKVALRSALSDSSGMHEDDISILSLRPGSIIADVQLSGRKQDVSTAVTNLQAQASQLSALCSAIGADANCRAEVSSVTVIPSPENYEPPARPVEKAAETERSASPLFVAVLPAALVITGLLMIYVVIRKMVKMQRAKIETDYANTEKTVKVIGEHKEQLDLDETASTATPSENNSQNSFSFDGWEQTPPGTPLGSLYDEGSTV